MLAAGFTELAGRGTYGLENTVIVLNLLPPTPHPHRLSPNTCAAMCSDSLNQEGPHSAA